MNDNYFDKCVPCDESELDFQNVSIYNTDEVVCTWNGERIEPCRGTLEIKAPYTKVTELDDGKVSVTLILESGDMASVEVYQDSIIHKYFLEMSEKGYDSSPYRMDIDKQGICQIHLPDKIKTVDIAGELSYGV